LKDKVSYSIGLDLGFNFKKQNLELQSTLSLAGVKDALSGNNLCSMKMRLKKL